MRQTIPCTIMRGGTSKGIYFLLSDLPRDEPARNALLLKLVGGDARQVNGLGGGDMLNAKVAIVSPAAEKAADIDYRFVQVVPGENRVDTGPTCGNILAGVGAFAIEQGLVQAADGITTLTVRDINTGARIEQVLQTPGGKVTYAGSCVISGAPAAAAPVMLYYLDFAGSKTGALFPSGSKTDCIEGIQATCIDAAMPTVLVSAAALGARGDEPAAELQNNAPLLARLEKVRLAAAQKMGLGDARGKVIPKVALVRAPLSGGAICARYFTPVTAHAAFAVSGGIALASALMTPGTVPAQHARPPAASNNNSSGDNSNNDNISEYDVDIEHPSGLMRVTLQLQQSGNETLPLKAGILRTTRLIMSGQTYTEAL